MVVAGSVVAGTVMMAGVGFTIVAATARAAVTSRAPPVATLPVNAAALCTLESSAVRSCATVSVGYEDSSTAAAPATCGVAIDVPAIHWYPPLRYVE